jgi:hypothetical protein
MTILRIAAATAGLLASFGTAAPTLVSGIDGRDVKGFSYGNEKVRGVNLGGWFVLERKLHRTGSFVLRVDDSSLCADLTSQHGSLPAFLNKALQAL